MWSSSMKPSPEKKRVITWSLALLAIASTVSIVTVYEVHEHQHANLYDSHPSVYSSAANTVEDDLEMEQTLNALDELFDPATKKRSTALHTSTAIIQGDAGDVGTVDAALTDQVCHAEQNTEYDGYAVIKWGSTHLQPTAGECCNACTIDPDCNIWVWCGDIHGCGTDRKYKECWLKKSSLKGIMDAKGFSNPNIGWLSGAIFDEDEKTKIASAEAKRIADLAANPDLPLVFLDIGVQGKLIGRIKMVLFSKESPRAAENFRALCTGEKGDVPEGKEGAGRPYHFKGATFYRIIDRFIDQTGANTESVFGGQFKDDAGGLQLKHDRKGLLSMANAGPDTNTSHFSILMAPAPHLDTHYTVFGEIVEGFDIAQKINSLSRGKPNNTAGPEEQVTILDCGQLR